MAINETNRDYESVNRPYDSLLNRSEATINEDSSDSSTSGSNGAVEEQPVKSDGAIGDVWIKNFIRSQNWKPKKVGFYIDGRTGKAEFSNVYVSGNIQALTGTIGGFIITEDSLQTSATVGDGSALSDGILIDATGFYACETNQTLSNANVKILTDGTLSVTGGTITGGTISGNTITGGTINGTTITGTTISGNTITGGTVSGTTITGTTITGGIFRTAASGERIEMTSTAANHINFYKNEDLYGWLEVASDGLYDRYIKLETSEGASLEILNSMGASTFTSASLGANGGEFSTNGNASNGFIGMYANGTSGGINYFHIVRTPGGFYIETDLKINSNWIPYITSTYNLGSSTRGFKNLYLSNGFLNLAVMSGATSASLPSQVGSMYLRNDDDVLRLRKASGWVTVNTTP